MKIKFGKLVMKRYAIVHRRSTWAQRPFMHIGPGKSRSSLRHGAPGNPPAMLQTAAEHADIRGPAG
jgi:hypothetical protein